MIIAAAALAVLLFAVALKFSGIYPLTLDVIASARAAARVMSDPSLDDDQREVRVQKAALHLFKRAAQIILLTVVVVGVPLIALVALDAVGLAELEAVFALMMRWDFILVATVVAIALFWVWR
jgi:hypothetical protein